MSGFERLVDEALREPLAAARAHASGAGRAIGYVGSDIPVELIDASEAFAVRLPSAADRDVSAADRYLESRFAPQVSSIMQQYLQGEFDFLDAIVLSRGDDSAQRLYYYLTELRRRELSRGPKPLIFDLAKIPRETSRTHTRAATHRLAAELCTDAERLEGAIERRNRRRELSAALCRARLAAVPVRGSVAERIGRAADRCDADVFDAAFAQWLARPAMSAAGPRVILIGSVPPDERLHRAVEEAGGNIVAEWGEHLPGSAGSAPLEAHGSIDAVADHYHARRGGTRGFGDPGAAVRELALAARADGAIVWLVEQEEALVWDLPMQLKALSAVRVPALALHRRRWDGTDSLADIAAFTRTLEGSP